MQSQRSGRTQQLAKSPRESDAAQRPAESGSSSGEPDFISRRRPGSSDSAGPSLSQIRPLTIQVNHTDGAPVTAKTSVAGRPRSRDSVEFGELMKTASGSPSHSAL